MKKARILLIGIIVLALIFSLAPSIAANSLPSPVPVSPGLTFDLPSFDFSAWRAAFLPPRETKLFLSDAENAALGNMWPGASQVVAFNMPFFWADEELIWTSSDNSVATVTPLEDHNGRINAVGPGTALITVSTPDGSFTRSFEVVVQ